MEGSGSVDVLILVLELHHLLVPYPDRSTSKKTDFKIDSEQFVGQVLFPRFFCSRQTVMNAMHAWFRSCYRSKLLMTQICTFLSLFQHINSWNRLAVLLCNTTGVKCVYEDLDSVGTTRQQGKPQGAGCSVLTGLQSLCSGDSPAFCFRSMFPSDIPLASATSDLAGATLMSILL